MKPRHEPTAHSGPPTRRELIAAGAGLVALSACGGARSERGPTAPDPERLAQLDGLLAELTDQSARVQPISASERAPRRTRLGQILARAGLDAFVCEPGPTLGYLTGFSWGRSERLFALCVLADGSHFWICPAFEEPKARLRLAAQPGLGDALLAWQEHEYAWPPLAAALRARKVERVSFDPQMRLFAADGIAQAFGRERCRMAHDVLLELRGRKEPREIEILRLANELTQQGIAAAARHVRPGMSGAAIGALMRRAQERLGLRDTWVLPLVGAAAAFPHGEHDELLLERGQVLLVDTGGSLHGYQSDITRSWVPAGEPSAELERAWLTVRAAQRAAFETIRPGVACHAVDRAARNVIEKAGYGDGYTAFAHRLGHGIGLEGHEDPYFDGGSEVRLASGMTLSNEPGIYLYGQFGLRLEDIMLVTEGGAQNFGAWQTSPASPA